MRSFEGQRRIFASCVLTFCLHAIGVAQTGKPFITAIANAASYASGPIAPGEMVVIFGMNLGPTPLVNLQLTADGRISTTLAGVQVLFDSVAAPLIYVSATQIAAMVPYSVTGSSSVQVQIVYQGVTSQPFPKAVSLSAPGIFSADAAGTGQGAITNSDGALNSSTNQVNPGSYVTLYLTGEGQTDPLGFDGNIATSTATVLLPSSATIGGHPAQILYAGSAPGNVNGFAQINLIVPTDLPNGGNLPLVVNIGGAFSQPGITVAVLGPPAIVPGAPMKATANVTSTNQILVTWSPGDTLATRFYVERQTVNSSGGFTEIAAVASNLNSFTDTSAIPGTTYLYRIRAENDSGFSNYSNIASAMVPRPPGQLLPPSNLQAIVVSQTQISLTWNPANTNATAFQIEKKIGLTGVYAPLVTLPNSTASYSDMAVATGNTYVYRIRSQGTSGLSAFSNEVSASTPVAQLPAAPVLQATPAAPTNLTATAISPTQVNLTWTNNAPDATAIRVELRSGGKTVFSDIGAAAALTSTGVPNLQPNVSYSFRIRAQSPAGYSEYSNIASVTTSIPTTVFLLHGLNQDHTDMRTLALNLASTYGLAAGRFRIDFGFDFSDCAQASPAFCSSNCTIPGGAERLAQYIVSANPPGDMVLVGFSMGGLIARDLIVNNRILLNGRKVHLVTIGTPNLGYPYLVTDNFVFCSAIVSAMEGNWRSQPGSVALSSYLLTLTNQWSAFGFPGNSRAWLAASGRACNVPTRLTTGCNDQNPYSDGVVCQDSAGYNINTQAGTRPNYLWSDPNRMYVHSFNGFTSLILCDTSDTTKYFPLWNPPPTGALFSTLIAVLNGL